MREIEFRAKRIDNSKWVYGGLYGCDKFARIVITSPYINEDGENDSLEEYYCDPYDVDINTIGQFTGLCDKNGEKIYEGDVVRFNNQTGKVVYEYGSFGVGIEEGIDYDRLEDFTRENLDNTFEGTFNDNFLPLFEIYYNLNNIDGYIDEIEVIGNIYDNPELLGEQKAIFKFLLPTSKNGE